MKNTLFILIAIFALFTSSCKKKGEPIIEISEFSIDVPKKIDNAVFTVSDLMDSRCPINAFCVSSGKISLSLKVQGTNNTENFILCSGACTANGSTDVVSFVSGNIKYTVKLKDVSPYPTGSSTKQTIVVKLEITKG